MERAQGNINAGLDLTNSTHFFPAMQNQSVAPPPYSSVINVSIEQLIRKTFDQPAIVMTERPSREL